MSERQLFSALSDGEVTSGIFISSICTLVTSLHSSGNEQLMDLVRQLKCLQRDFFWPKPSVLLQDG